MPKAPPGVFSQVHKAHRVAAQCADQHHAERALSEGIGGDRWRLWSGDEIRSSIRLLLYGLQRGLNILDLALKAG